MKLYNAFIKKDLENKIEDVILLEEGFSYGAFIFSGFWFLFHRMWAYFFLTILANFALQFLSKHELISDFNTLFLAVVFVFFVAYNANHWFGQFLQRKGYDLSGLVLANSKAEARIKAVQALYVDYPDLTIEEFSEAIVDPRSYRKHFYNHKQTT